MPYISKEARRDLDPLLEKIGKLPLLDGEINYLLTRILKDQIATHRDVAYANFNSMVGVLECVKLELYRTDVAPYEQQKMVENGAVVGVDQNAEEDGRDG